MTNDARIYTVTAEDGVTQADILPELGAICTSLRVPSRRGNRELLYQSEQMLVEYEWVDRIGGLSLCFPTCGQLQREGRWGLYYFADALYELPQHGFAGHQAWEVANHAQDRLALILRDNEATQACYPFQFVIELDFIIHSGSLLCRFTLTNRGNQALPYYAGFNCYLQTTAQMLGNEHLVLNYQPVRSLLYDEENGDIIGERSLFDTPIALSALESGKLFTQLGENKQIALRYPHGDCFYMTAEGVGIKNMFPYVQLENRPHQSYMGIHPWMGYPNALNSVQGVRWLAPKASEQGCLQLSFEVAH